MTKRWPGATTIFKRTAISSLYLVGDLKVLNIENVVFEGEFFLLLFNMQNKKYRNSKISFWFALSVLVWKLQTTFFFINYLILRVIHLSWFFENKKKKEILYDTFVSIRNLWFTQYRVFFFNSLIKRDIYPWIQRASLILDRCYASVNCSVLRSSCFCRLRLPQILLLELLYRVYERGRPCSGCGTRSLIHKVDIPVNKEHAQEPFIFFILLHVQS